MTEMPDLYEQWAAETLSIANQQLPHEADWRDAYEEIASELLSLANASRRL
jgi:hypothetical protein